MCKACGCHGPQLAKKVVPVDGLSCDHCKSSLEKAVRGLVGVMAGEVNLENKTLTVEFDPKKTTFKMITAVIEEAGFSVPA